MRVTEVEKKQSSYMSLCTPNRWQISLYFIIDIACAFSEVFQVLSEPALHNEHYLSHLYILGSLSMFSNVRYMSFCIRKEAARLAEAEARRKRRSEVVRVRAYRHTQGYTHAHTISCISATDYGMRMHISCTRYKCTCATTIRPARLRQQFVYACAHVEFGSAVD